VAIAARGLFFEDFSVGQALETPRRTITSTDIVNFACLSGDFNGVHADHEYCKTTPFGEPIAHAPLVYAVMGGLQYASGVNDGTLLAVLGIDEWRMLKAVKHGDTLHMCSTVMSKRETSNPDRGVVTFKREFINQHEETVQSMTATFMYKRRTAALSTEK
jgi:acyl dehydratase